jgi:hypothetical protein
VRSWASSFNFQYLLASLRSSKSCLRLLPRLHFPIIFPPMMCFRRQFLRNMCPIQLAFFRLIVWIMFLCSFILCNIASLFKRSIQLIFSILLQHHISELSRYFWSISRKVCFRTTQSYAPNVVLH